MHKALEQAALSDYKQTAHREQNATEAAFT